MNDDCGSVTPTKTTVKRKPLTPEQKAKGLERNRRWRKENREKVRGFTQKWRENNREKSREIERAWRAANPDKTKAKTKRYLKTKGLKHLKSRRENDPWFANRQSLSLRTRMAIKAQGGSKTGSILQILGAPIVVVRAHIQSQFKKGMTWKNWGRKGWHLDHIVPCAAFDLTNEEQRRKCFHYTNLRPLWAVENLLKSDQIVTCQPELPLVLSTN